MAKTIDRKNELNDTRGIFKVRRYQNSDQEKVAGSRRFFKGALKIQMRQIKIYIIKTSNLYREKYVTTFEHRRTH